MRMHRAALGLICIIRAPAIRLHTRVTLGSKFLIGANYAPAWPSSGSRIPPGFLQDSSRIPGILSGILPSVDREMGSDVLI